jgi:hypothetical protein
MVVGFIEDCYCWIVLLVYYSSESGAFDIFLFEVGETKSRHPDVNEKPTEGWIGWNGKNG